MPRFAPSTHLITHDVTNQPPDFAGRNLFTSDPIMRAAALREGGEWVDAPLSALGQDLGTEEVLQWGEEANRFPPELTVFDRYGRRIDEARFHPSYHKLMELGMRHGVHSIAWSREQPGSHVAHAGLLALFSEAEQGVTCPMSMTYASVPALKHQPDVAAEWVPKIVNGTYDAPLKPIAEKRGVTVGMAMTEKQGGSDVRANSTRAVRDGDAYRLVGHKWFCSAPMSDGFLTLAQTEKGLSCFLVPRITPDGERNSLHVMRLKDKLGNKSNASSEIEYHNTYAVLLGEEGRGVSTIIEMVHHTRLDTISGTIGMMRMGLAQANHHVSNRRAFQKTLIDQPVMRAVIADLALEYEAAVMLTMRVARAFSAKDEQERAFARLAVAVAKYWLTKRNPNFTYECMECHGGAGYVEESPMPRLYREAPLNAIWEGSGNVIALDILRTLGKEPAAREALAAEVMSARGAYPVLDRAMEDLAAAVKGAPSEGDARRLAERMALILQATLMAKHAPAAAADAFIATRLGEDGGRSFGVLPRGTDLDTIVGRVAA